MHVPSAKTPAYSLWEGMDSYGPVRVFRFHMSLIFLLLEHTGILTMFWHINSNDPVSDEIIKFDKIECCFFVFPETEMRMQWGVFVAVSLWSVVSGPRTKADACCVYQTQVIQVEQKRNERLSEPVLKVISSQFIFIIVCCKNITSFCSRLDLCKWLIPHTSFNSLYDFREKREEVTYRQSDLLSHWLIFILLVWKHGTCYLRRDFYIS